LRLDNAVKHLVCVENSFYKYNRDMHYLQKNILDMLRYRQPLSYTALIPDGIESSHFQYHLKLLIKDGLVIKDAQGSYRLTDKGEREVDYLSERRTTLMRMPKIITYTLLTYRGQTLLYKKAKEPYRHLWGLIGGKIHFGEAAADAAIREVFEKTGITIQSPRFCGVADIRIYKHEQPLSHVVAYVYIAQLQALPASLPAELQIIDAAALARDAMIPDVLPILESIRTFETENQPFVRHLLCHLATRA
jgi:ADP-ribose pyrophosphatase YjhB (NUDIX family)